MSDFVEMLRLTVGEYARRKGVRRGRRRAGEAPPRAVAAEEETVYLVLDNAERLRGLDGGKFLAALLCLGEVCWELPPAEARAGTPTLLRPTRPRANPSAAPCTFPTATPC